ncbi:MAG: serine/threonine protein kinase [Planctomycetes bacterium]|nr:serine/threonine protein kinase [Planctomycetota bacterium]
MTDPQQRSLAVSARTKPLGPDVAALLADYLLAAEVGPVPVLTEFLARLPSAAERERFVGLIDEAAFAGRQLPLRLRPQRVLADRYELIEPIGSGGMGQVWRANDRRLDCDVAVKVLSAAATTLDLDRLVAREGQLLARLSHPGVVRVVDTGHDGQQRFLVMELVGGMALDDVVDRLRERRHELARSLRGADVLALVGTAAVGRTAVLDGSESWSVAATKILIELLRTLEATHGVGVVHRDLKPGNVRLTGGGFPVLLDFGIGFRADRQQGPQTAELFGTAQYAAPEQWAGAAGVGMHTDVYQAGLVLYELLTLQRCFGGTSPIETMRAVRDASYQRPRELDRSIDPRLEACVLRAIEVDPARRYASAVACRSDLEAFLAGQIPSAAAATAKWSWRVRAGARRHRRSLSMAAAALVGAGALWLLRGEPAPGVQWAAAQTVTVDVPGPARMTGFLIGRNERGEVYCSSLRFGADVARAVPAGRTAVDLQPVGDAQRFADIAVSTLFADDGDADAQRRFAAVVQTMDRVRRAIEAREGEWLPEAEFRAHFLAGRGGAAVEVPVAALFADGAWTAHGLQGRVVARPSP